MNAILVLLVVSALVGLILGFYFPWGAILVSGLILAMLAATVLQNEGFGFLAGIAITVVCLTVNQIAYLIGAALVTRGPKANKISLPGDQPNNAPGETSHKDIAGEHKQQEKTPPWFVPTSE